MGHCGSAKCISAQTFAQLVTFIEAKEQHIITLLVHLPCSLSSLHSYHASGWGQNLYILEYEDFDLSHSLLTAL